MICSTCRDEGRVLQFYARGPGSPPGNGYVGCPDCERGRAFTDAIRRETDVQHTVAMGAAIAACPEYHDFIQQRVAALS